MLAKLVDRLLYVCMYIIVHHSVYIIGIGYNKKLFKLGNHANKRADNTKTDWKRKKSKQWRYVSVRVSVCGTKNYLL